MLIYKQNSYQFFYPEITFLSCPLHSHLSELMALSNHQRGRSSWIHLICAFLRAMLTHLRFTTMRDGKAVKKICHLMSPDKLLFRYARGFSRRHEVVNFPPHFRRCRRTAAILSSCIVHQRWNTRVRHGNSNNLERRAGKLQQATPRIPEALDLSNVPNEGKLCNFVPRNTTRRMNQLSQSSTRLFFAVT